ncbi:MAG: YggS family pyridoxal phosphate-dependent enzyme [Candidatus Cloacimonadota bacterium]|nr:MAG: YggS family pyridoxal phosphate-dependent enzyme [Candidatus Cloacimonadota bacterium]PIE78491.1 MAG: YggS family pyridoxal phosphate-dependent enzyme [Candidatus Delongbacteria bacterium]
MIKDKLDKVLKEIKEISKEAILVAVSKTKPIELLEEAYKAGQRDFGENKVQELEVKRKYFLEKGVNDIRWHLIGHLQSNKAKTAVLNADIFHCLDSVKLARRINNLSKEFDKVMKVLIQVNSSGEEQKSGISPKELKSFIEDCKDFDNIEIFGLMSIGKFNANPEDSRDEFKLMKSLYDSIENIDQENLKLEFLSMGMSNDYHIALEEGSNLVRVGSSIFGKRNYG